MTILTVFRCTIYSFEIGNIFRLDQCIIYLFFFLQTIYFDFQIVITSDINIFHELNLLIKILLFVGTPV